MFFNLNYHFSIHSILNCMISEFVYIELSLFFEKNMKGIMFNLLDKDVSLHLGDDKESVPNFISQDF